MSVYRGQREPHGCIVTVDGVPLHPCFEVRNHSPTGFEWGYGGSGPAQLALAILCHAYGRREGERLYQDFKWDVIALLDGDGWEFSTHDIHDWLFARYAREFDEEALRLEREGKAPRS